MVLGVLLTCFLPLCAAGTTSVAPPPSTTAPLGMTAISFSNTTAFSGASKGQQQQQGAALRTMHAGALGPGT